MHTGNCKRQVFELESGEKILAGESFLFIRMILLQKKRFTADICVNFPHFFF
jgi:hypothetical protein